MTNTRKTNPPAKKVQGLPEGTLRTTMTHLLVGDQVLVQTQTADPESWWVPAPAKPTKRALWCTVVKVNLSTILVEVNDAPVRDQIILDYVAHTAITIRDREINEPAPAHNVLGGNDYVDNLINMCDELLTAPTVTVTGTHVHREARGGRAWCPVPVLDGDEITGDAARVTCPVCMVADTVSAEVVADAVYSYELDCYVVHMWDVDAGRSVPVPVAELGARPAEAPVGEQAETQCYCEINSESCPRCNSHEHDPAECAMPEISVTDARITAVGDRVRVEHDGVGTVTEVDEYTGITVRLDSDGTLVEAAPHQCRPVVDADTVAVRALMTGDTADADAAVAALVGMLPAPRGREIVASAERPLAETLPQGADPASEKCECESILCVVRGVHGYNACQGTPTHRRWIDLCTGCYEATGPDATATDDERAACRAWERAERERMLVEDAALLSEVMPLVTPEEAVETLRRAAGESVWVARNGKRKASLGRRR